MKLRAKQHQPHPGGNPGQRASILIIVMWVALGLVGIALYFADSMSLELKAAGNRTAGLASEQAIEGAARYVSYVLANYATNGNVPDLSLYNCEAVPVGDAHFWIIGRDNSGDIPVDPAFGLIDEAAKINLNSADTNTLSNLPNITADFVEAISEWRSTNAPTSDLNYAALGYTPKLAPFETEDELRLVYGATMDLLAGEDINGNGVLDANETDLNGNGQLAPGLFEYTTVYSREPNIHSDGSSLTNVANQAQLSSLLTQTFGTSRALQIMGQLGFGRSASGRPRVVTFSGMLDFYLHSGMTETEFAQVANNLTTSTRTFTRGRVNINTASATVLSCLPGMDLGTAQQLISYRQQNPSQLNTIAWIVDALGSGSQAIQSLRAGDYLTVRSFQFTADVAALGPYGRGYRRTRFVFDLCDGTPKIIYRQDLSRLGWALGDTVRETWVTKATQ